MRAAKQLVTLRGPLRARRGAEMAELAIIPDGALLIRNGRIEDVGITRRVERLKGAQQAVEVDASGSVVMPAFIDSGTLPLWAKVPLQLATRAMLVKQGHAVLAGMARHGTLSAEVQSGVGGDVLGELRLLRIYDAMQAQPISLLPSFLFESRALSLALLDRIARLRLAASVTARVGNEQGHWAEIREFLQTARNLRLHTTVEARQGCLRQALAIAVESGAAAVSGVEELSDAAIQALLSADTLPLLAPAVAYAQKRDRFTQARNLIDQGAAVALGTQFHAERNPDYNMLHTLSLACRHNGMSPEEAIVAGTLNAAYATGCGKDRGSLEPGKWADLVIFDCPHYESLVHNGAVNQVSRVLRRGKTIYRRGRMDGPE